MQKCRCGCEDFDFRMEEYKHSTYLYCYCKQCGKPVKNACDKDFQKYLDVDVSKYTVK